MRYAIHIDEVVLHGFRNVDRRRLSAGLMEELGRQFGRDGLGWESRERERVDAGHVRVSQGDDRATGRSIARGVYAGLRK